MNINFDCNNCKKVNVCKYTEQIPDLLSTIEGKIDNEACPEIIDFYATCSEFDRKASTRDFFN